MNNQKSNVINYVKKLETDYTLIFKKNDKFLLILVSVPILAFSLPFNLLTVLPVTANSGLFVEDFSTSTYRDNSTSSTTGWGTGQLQLPHQELTLIGSYDTSDYVMDVVVDHHLAFLADSSNGLIILNISNPTNPTWVSTFNTAGSAVSVAIDGDYGFIGDSNGGLVIVNLTEVTTPTTAANYSSVTSVVEVAVDGNNVFLADSSNGLEVVDITDLSNPKNLDSYNTLGSVTHGISVDGDLGVVVDDHSVQVVNLTDPTNIAPIGNIATTGTALDVTITGNLAYVADNTSGLAIVDLTDPTTPSIVGTYDTTANAYGVDVSGDYCYLAESGEGLVILNVSNPSSPQLLDKYSTMSENVVVEGEYAFVASGAAGLEIIQVRTSTSFNAVVVESTAGTATDLLVKDNYVYAIDSTDMYIIEASDPMNPQTISTFMFSWTPRGIDVMGDYAYIVHDNGGMYILDVSNALSPELAKFVPQFSGYAAFDVSVSGNYAYVANEEDGLRIFDVATPSLTTEVGQYNTPGKAHSVTIDSDRKLVFIADWTQGLQIINITDPTTPTLVGSYDTPSYAQDIYRIGDLVYIADLTTLQIINTSDPTTPTLVNSYDASGSVNGVFIDGNKAFLAVGSAGIEVVDLSDLTTPASLGVYDTPSIASDLYINGSYAFVADSSAGIRIINLERFPSNPKWISEFITPNSAFDVEVKGDIAFIAAFNSGLYIVNVSNPKNPTLVSNFTTAGLAWAVEVSGDYAFMATYTAGLRVIDISDLANPLEVGFYDTSGFARDLVLVGDYCFIADTARGILVLDVSDPTTPTIVRTYNALGSAYDVIIRGNLAITTGDSSWGMKILNVTNPATASLLGYYNTLAIVEGVAAIKDYAYLAMGNSGMRIVNISEPSNPSFIMNYDLGSGTAYDVSIFGTYLYVAENNGGLEILDINTPISPKWIGNTYNPPRYSRTAYIEGNYAYVADSTKGLQIVEVFRSVPQQFSSVATAQSLAAFNSPASTLIVGASITAVANTPTGTLVNYYMSADNGSHWEKVSLGNVQTFSHAGTILRWKAELITTNSLVSPTLSSITINYRYQINVAPTLMTPVNETITAQTQPQFEWTSVTGVSSYQLQVDTSSDFTSPNYISVNTSSTTHDLTSTTLAEGLWYWRVTAIDPQDDLGVFSTVFAIIIDTTVPFIDQPNDFFYVEGTIGHTITWNPSDSNPASYSISNNSVIEKGGPWNGESLSIDVNYLTAGTYTFVCTVVDQTGLQNNDTLVVTVYDTSAPNIDHPASITYEEGLVSYNLVWTPTDTDPASYKITNNSVLVQSDLWEGGTIALDIGGLIFGTYVFTCTVTDLANHSTSSSVDVSVIDTLAPNLDHPSDVEYEVNTIGHILRWIATDTNPGSYIVYQDGQVNSTDVWTNASWILIDIDGLQIGEFNYTIVVNDSSNNIQMDTVIITVTSDDITTTTTTTTTNPPTTTTTTTTTTNPPTTTTIKITTFSSPGFFLTLVVVGLLSILGRRKLRNYKRQ